MLSQLVIIQTTALIFLQINLKGPLIGKQIILNVWPFFRTAL